MHRNLKEMLIRSKQENSDLRAEVETLPRLKDRLRTLELQLKVILIELTYSLVNIKLPYIDAQTRSAWKAKTVIART